MKFRTFTTGDGNRLGAALDNGNVLDLTAMLRWQSGAGAVGSANW